MPLPISVADVEAYARLNSLTPAEGKTLLGWMCEMDKLYLERRFKQIEEEAKKNSRRNRGRNRGG